ncbi:Coiled-coil and C2 domain-containing protein 2A [Rhizoclosmatium hyalinum]|nr:Coiled-coil and C2 domain-containing protein 2A [Rhizoclosmatium hyalinum]
MDSEVGMERIYFNIFDELLIDIIDDDRVRDVEIHQRRERNWLGSFSMPFTALYEQTRIEGSFHVQIPTVLLGYEKNPSAGALDNSLFLALEATKETLVDVFITLEPPLLQPAPLKLRFLSDENDRFLRYATKWCAPLLLHPTRQFIATALDLSGRTTFICRYIRPQQPPEELLTPRHLLRYVSTIPYLPDRTAFSADVSLWATSDQMLELCAGDAAEHAILLCNYLLAKGGDNIEAYVVIGHGIPEGRTAYVAMRGKSATSANVEMTLMNAITGQSYSVRDPHLPLKVVGCVFNAENVWANIQAHDDPARIVWNISAPKLWKPFFCRSFPKIEYKSVQLEKLHYKEVSARYCQELEILIEKSIVAKVEEWRGHRITRWNRYSIFNS